MLSVVSPPLVVFFLIFLDQFYPFLFLFFRTPGSACFLYTYLCIFSYFWLKINSVLSVSSCVTSYSLQWILRINSRSVLLVLLIILYWSDIQPFFISTLYIFIQSSVLSAPCILKFFILGCHSPLINKSMIILLFQSQLWRTSSATQSLSLITEVLLNPNIEVLNVNTFDSLLQTYWKSKYSAWPKKKGATK